MIHQVKHPEASFALTLVSKDPLSLDLLEELEASFLYYRYPHLEEDPLPWIISFTEGN